jgi:acetyltransferase-like isoleucine patch superfamily enzyme
MYVTRKADYVRSLTRDPLEAARLLRILAATFKFRYLRRCAGRGTIFGTHNRIINAANVRIGTDCLFQDFIYIRAGIQGRVLIGNRVAVNSFCQMYGHGGIDVGDDSQIGPGSLITTTGHDYGREDLREHFTRVAIGRRVWIGANVTILSGVTIGDGAVIGAGAVVNRDIPAASLAVGVPARVVRTLQVPASGVGDALRRPDEAPLHRVHEPPRKPKHDLNKASG